MKNLLCLILFPLLFSCTSNIQSSSKLDLGDTLKSDSVVAEVTKENIIEVEPIFLALRNDKENSYIVMDYIPNNIIDSLTYAFINNKVRKVFCKKTNDSLSNFYLNNSADKSDVQDIALIMDSTYFSKYKIVPFTIDNSIVNEKLIKEVENEYELKCIHSKSLVSFENSYSLKTFLMKNNENVSIILLTLCKGNKVETFIEFTSESDIENSLSSISIISILREGKEFSFIVLNNNEKKYYLLETNGDSFTEIYATK